MCLADMRMCLIQNKLWLSTCIVQVALVSAAAKPTRTHGRRLEGAMLRVGLGLGIFLFMAMLIFGFVIGNHLLHKRRRRLLMAESRTAYEDIEARRKGENQQDPRPLVKAYEEAQPKVVMNFYSMDSLLHPSLPVSDEKIRQIRHASLELLKSGEAGCHHTLYPEVILVYEHDRANSLGFFYAAAVTKYLWQHGVPCFSNLMIPPDQDHDDYLGTLSSRSWKCRVLILVEMCSLYSSTQCYEEISLICRAGVSIIKLRFESGVVKDSLAWPSLQTLPQGSPEFQVHKSVKTSLSSAMEIPSRPGTVPQFPKALDKLLENVSAHISQPTTQYNGAHNPVEERKDIAVDDECLCDGAEEASIKNSISAMHENIGEKMSMYMGSAPSCSLLAAFEATLALIKLQRAVRRRLYGNPEVRSRLEKRTMPPKTRTKPLKLKSKAGTCLGVTAEPMCQQTLERSSPARCKKHCDADGAGGHGCKKAPGHANTADRIKLHDGDGHKKLQDAETGGQDWKPTPTGGCKKHHDGEMPTASPAKKLQRRKRGSREEYANKRGSTDSELMHAKKTMGKDKQVGKVPPLKLPVPKGSPLDMGQTSPTTKDALLSIKHMNSSGVTQKTTPFTGSPRLLSPELSNGAGPMQKTLSSSPRPPVTQCLSTSASGVEFAAQKVGPQLSNGADAMLKTVSSSTRPPVQQCFSTTASGVEYVVHKVPSKKPPCTKHHHKQGRTVHV